MPPSHASWMVSTQLGSTTPLDCQQLCGTKATAAVAAAAAATAAAAAATAVVVSCVAQNMIGVIAVTTTDAAGHTLQDGHGNSYRITANSYPLPRRHRHGATVMRELTSTPAFPASAVAAMAASNSGRAQRTVFKGTITGICDNAVSGKSAIGARIVVWKRNSASKTHFAMCESQGPREKSPEVSTTFVKSLP
jgi:hypothetical protein